MFFVKYVVLPIGISLGVSWLVGTLFLGKNSSSSSRSRSSYGTSGGKQPSHSQLVSAAKSAASSTSYVSFVSVEGNTVVLSVDGNRGDINVNNQVDEFMYQLSCNLSGYDLSGVDVRYSTRYR